MLYSYTITSNFLKELANLEYNKTEKICGFIKSQFIKKPNLYLSINRKILEKKYGDKSNDQIDKLIKTLSNHNKEIFEKKNISKDFIFVGKEDKYGKIKINCDAILNNPEKVENFIESKMDDYWSGGSEPQKFIKLQEHFNRIFLFNENIVFVYRFLIIPYIEINHPKFLKNNHPRILTIYFDESSLSSLKKNGSFIFLLEGLVLKSPLKKIRSLFSLIISFKK